ncbi:RING-H2 finger protein ATL2-like [Mangifera indica]|uniref:RING-H2 finger protein ATL2-like n=1 Tax=Mangifera indica TaxID=29780 RepID=UPI001CFC1E0D|nr:RING-H2 finger protein ATL2-like [Mangifera indica]
MNNEFNDQPDLYAPDNNSYALSGKIMLSAIVILFFVVILMVCLHLYARWYLLNVRRRQIRPSRFHRRTHLVFYVDPANPNPVAAATRGLDAAVLKSLPVFAYSSKTHPESLDCAVCLSEFEENESGRILPKCKHSFHIECIDMWFHSHSTCPLCRSSVEPCQDEPENPTHVAVSVTEPGSSSGLFMTRQHEDETAGTSSFEDKGKPRDVINVSIEVPARNYNEGFDSESTRCDSPSSQVQTQSSFRSPVSRMLSFKRILSRERRGNLSPSGNTASCGGTVTELDIERGRE